MGGLAAVEEPIRRPQTEKRTGGRSQSTMDSNAQLEQGRREHRPILTTIPPASQYITTGGTTTTTNRSDPSTSTAATRHHNQERNLSHSNPSSHDITPSTGDQPSSETAAGDGTDTTRTTSLTATATLAATAPTNRTRRRDWRRLGYRVLHAKGHPQLQSTKDSWIPMMGGEREGWRTSCRKCSRNKATRNLRRCSWLCLALNRHWRGMFPNAATPQWSRTRGEKRSQYKKQGQLCGG